MLQKRKFPKLSTQSFTDPKRKIHEVVTLQHQVSSGVPCAPRHLSKSPTSKTTRRKEERLSDKERIFLCCWGRMYLRYKATVIFRGTAETTEPLLGTRKRKMLGELCGTGMALSHPQGEESWPLHLAALMQAYWHRNAATWVKSLS